MKTEIDRICGIMHTLLAHEPIIDVPYEKINDIAVALVKDGYGNISEYETEMETLRSKIKVLEQRLNDKYIKIDNLNEIAYADGKIYKCNERVPDTYALNIEWRANGVGFGELNIKYNEKTGKWSKDTEYMSDEFCQAVLAKWLAGMERG